MLFTLSQVSPKTVRQFENRNVMIAHVFQHSFVIMSFTYENIYLLVAGEVHIEGFLNYWVKSNENLQIRRIRSGKTDFEY